MKPSTPRSTKREETSRAASQVRWSHGLSNQHKNWAHHHLHHEIFTSSVILMEQRNSCSRLIENCLPQHFGTESKYKLAQLFLQIHDNASRNCAGAIACCSTCLVFLSHLFVSRSPTRNFHPKILPFPIRPVVSNLANTRRRDKSSWPRRRLTSQ